MRQHDILGRPLDWELAYSVALDFSGFIPRGLKSINCSIYDYDGLEGCHFFQGK